MILLWITCGIVYLLLAIPAQALLLVYTDREDNNDVWGAFLVWPLILVMIFVDTVFHNLPAQLADTIRKARSK